MAVEYPCYVNVLVLHPKISQKVNSTSIYLNNCPKFQFNHKSECYFSDMDNTDISGMKYLKEDNKFKDFGLVLSFNFCLDCGLAKGSILIGLNARLM